MKMLFNSAACMIVIGLSLFTVTEARNILGKHFNEQQQGQTWGAQPLAMEDSTQELSEADHLLLEPFLSAASQLDNITRIASLSKFLRSNISLSHGAVNSMRYKVAPAGRLAIVQALHAGGKVSLSAPHAKKSEQHLDTKVERHFKNPLTLLKNQMTNAASDLKSALVDFFNGEIKEDAAVKEDPSAAVPGGADAVQPSLYEECGKSGLHRHKRVVNGSASQSGQWPWMASVVSKFELFSGWYIVRSSCGGVLLSRQHVITAGHCAISPIADLEVKLGTIQQHSVDSDNIGTVIRRVKKVYRYETEIDDRHDVAILELSEAVTLTWNIRTICLPQNSQDFTWHYGTVAGWGLTSSSSSERPDSLQHVDVPVISSRECGRWYALEGVTESILPQFFCAGYQIGWKDACDGDSGGPLMMQHSSSWLLAGLVSHGLDCAAPNMPGVYVNVSYYVPWIQEVLLAESSDR